MDTPKGGIKLGTFAGAPVILSPSWFLIAAFVLFTFAPTVRDYLPDVSHRESYVVAGTYAILLLVSVLVHELAHAALARAYGLPVTQIVANLMGGHTQFGAEASRPGQSAVVAVGGPLANVALSLVGLAVRDLHDGGVVSLLGAALFWANGLLAIFNLLPGLPLDGGRAVESIVWGVTGQRVKGTVVAGWSGRVIAIVVLVWGVVLPWSRDGHPDLTLTIWSGLIAGLLWSGAGQALQWAAIRRRAAALDARRLARGAVPVHSTWTVSEVAELATEQHVQDIVVLDASGIPVGLTQLGPVADLARTRPETPVEALMLALPPYAVLPAGLTGEQLLTVLSQTPATATYALVDDQGGVGLVAGQDLVAAMGAKGR